MSLHENWHLTYPILFKFWDLVSFYFLKLSEERFHLIISRIGTSLDLMLTLGIIMRDHFINSDYVFEWFYWVREKHPIVIVNHQSVHYSVSQWNLSLSSWYVSV